MPGVPLPVSWTREGNIKIAPPPSIVDSDATVPIAFHQSCRHRCGPRGHRRLMAESLDEPLGVIARDELPDDPVRLGETLEAMEIEALLLQRPHEPLDDAVALRLPDI